MTHLNVYAIEKAIYMHHQELLDEAGRYRLAKQAQEGRTKRSGPFHERALTLIDALLHDGRQRFPRSSHRGNLGAIR